MSSPGPMATRSTPHPHQRPGHSEVSPWVLLQVGEGADHGFVVAEGAHPRHHTRLSRTRIAGSASVARHLPTVTEAAITTGEPQVGATYLPSGGHMRVVAVPVLDPADTVVAVQLWAGPRSRPVPARPSIGVLRWSVGHATALTTPIAEHLLDTDLATDSGRSVRSLPEVMRHLESVEDRSGLLCLFTATSSTPQRWAGIAVTRGLGTRTRRTLFLAASREAHTSVISTLVCDVSSVVPPPPPSIATSLLAAMPIRARHAIAVLDLGTGLVHEWIHPGPAPLTRWQHQIPEIHPDDLADLAATRIRLGAYVDHAATDWRLRFAPDEPWTTVRAAWRVLTREPTAQAMLDLRVLESAKSTARAETES